MPWTPPPRSPWTEKLIALGRGIGDNGRSLIALDPASLRQAARNGTGLDDFGDSWWEEPFHRLCTALDEEAELHLPGRLRTRGSCNSFCRTGSDWSTCGNASQPSPTKRSTPPIVVTGLGRSGTTLLHELLACDPDNRPPLLWEFLHSVPADRRAADRSRAFAIGVDDRPSCVTTRSS